MRTYQIHDRGSDYLIEIKGGLPIEGDTAEPLVDHIGRTFTMRASNLSILRKAVRFWRHLGFIRERDPNENL